MFMKIERVLVFLLDRIILHGQLETKIEMNGCICDIFNITELVVHKSFRHKQNILMHCNVQFLRYRL